MSRATECFSMYSLISSRVSADSSSKRNSASARASSVLPTPVGPAKRKLPMGRFGSCSQLRQRAVLQLRRAAQIALALGVGHLLIGVLDLLLRGADALDGLLLVLPVRLEPGHLLGEPRDLALDLLEPPARERVLLLLQRL